MPGAGDHRAVHNAIGKRATLMRTDAVDRRDGPLNIIDRVDPALELHLLGATGCEVVQARQFHKPRHFVVSRPIPSWADPSTAPLRRDAMGGLEPARPYRFATA